MHTAPRHPRHARHVPPRSGRSRALRLATSVIIRLLFPPIHQYQGMVDLQKMVVRFVPGDVSGSVTDATHVAEILTKTLMIIVAKRVFPGLAPSQGNILITAVVRVLQARSVSMHRTGCKVVLVFVTTARQHTIRSNINPSVSLALSTRMPTPVMRHVSLVMMNITAPER